MVKYYTKKQEDEPIDYLDLAKDQLLHMTGIVGQSAALQVAVLEIQAKAQLDIAISLRRIADALEKQNE